MAGLSAARIASQDWVGQARQLAGSTGPPLPSEPDQHYASFHIELLLDVDNSVRPSTQPCASTRPATLPSPSLSRAGGRPGRSSR
jgi:hypothetical protein